MINSQIWTATRKVQQDQSELLGTSQLPQVKAIANNTEGIYIRIDTKNGYKANLLTDPLFITLDSF